MRNSTRHSSEPFARSFRIKAVSSKDQPLNDDWEDFYIVSREDLPPAEPSCIGIQFDPRTSDDSCTNQQIQQVATPPQYQPFASSSQYTTSNTAASPLRLARIELADLTLDFPLPPTHIPLPSSRRVLARRTHSDLDTGASCPRN